VSPADLLGYAGGALRGHRLRTALSVTGVAIGIAAVVALTALGEGARRYVEQEFAALGTNLVIVVPGKSETTGGMPMPVGGTVQDLTLADFEALRTRLPQVACAAPIASGTEVVRAGSLSRSMAVLGTTSEMLEVRRLEVAAGRFLPPGDSDRGGAEIVLGATAARELFGGANPLGQVVRVGEWRFRVVGVMAPFGRSLLGIDFDDMAMVPVATAMRMFNRRSLFRIVVEVRSASELEAARRGIVAVLRERHRCEDVTIITQDAVVSTFSAIFRVLTLALVGIASISLTVAGVGIMNVMLVAVAERRREIGLLRAVGAGAGQVLAVFLAEAVVLAGLGGLAGVGFGLVVVRVFVHIYPTFPAAPPLWAVAASLAVSLVVGVAFGVLPARRASRLDPVQALAGR
jgi:putative ABC transport system permease protein